MCRVSLGWLQSAPLSSYNRLHATEDMMRLNNSGRFYSQLMDLFRADGEQELFSAYLCMTNQINSVASVQGLCHKNAQAQLILNGFLMSRLNREAKDFSLPGLSHWGANQGQREDAWQCLMGHYRRLHYPKLPGQQQCTDNLSTSQYEV